MLSLTSLKESIRLHSEKQAIASMPQPLRTPAEIGALIRDRRKARGLLQADLAARLGVSRLWVGEIERGKPGANLGLVLRALDMLGVRLVPQDAPAANPAADDLDAIIANASQR